MIIEDEHKVREIAREEIRSYIENSLEERVLSIMYKNIGSPRVESRDIDELKEKYRGELEEELALKMYSKLQGMVSEKNRRDFDAIVEEMRTLVTKFYSENKNLKVKIKSLSELEKVKIDNDQLTTRIIKADMEIKERDAKLLEKEKEIKKYELEKDGLKDLYRLKNLYESYMSIQYEIRAKLSKVIKSESIEEFLACCYSVETMENLWDFVSLHGRNREFTSIKDIKILAQIFEYFIDQENKKYNEDTYMVFSPRINDCYDPHKHIDIDGNGEDIVTDIVFPGYGWVGKNEENEKICIKINRPALVKTCSR